MALKIIQVLKRKTKNKTKQKHPNTTNYVTIIPKGQQNLATGDTPHEEYLQTSQVLLLPTGHDLWQSYLKLQIWLHSVDYKHFTLLVKLLVLLAPTMFCVLRFCDDGLKKKKGFFSTGMLNFKSAGCFTQHLLALEQSFPLLCLIFSWPSLF